MIKKLSIVTLILLSYHFLAATLLYTSNYLNVASYYTHPPARGGIELRRLPMLFGDTIAISVLNSKKSEAKQLIKNGEVGLAAILSSYQHNQALSEKEAKYRSMKIAELFIQAGYDASRCENDGRSVAKVLEDWNVFDTDMESFLRRFIDGKDLNTCH